jgi:hypothetical protein
MKVYFPIPIEAMHQWLKTVFLLLYSKVKAIALLQKKPHKACHQSDKTLQKASRNSHQSL